MVPAEGYVPGRRRYLTPNPSRWEGQLMVYVLDDPVWRELFADDAARRLWAVIASARAAGEDRASSAEMKAAVRASFAVIEQAATPPKQPAIVAAAPVMSDADILEFTERAVHEAGHAVAAVALGGQIERGFVLLPGQESDGCAGAVIMAAMPLGNAKPQIAYAGPWAQARFRASGRRPTPQEVGAAMSSSGRRDRAMCRTSSGSEGREVIGLLDRCWPAVISLAATLAGGEIRHEHVTAALGLSNDEQHHAFELANLRAGMRGVPNSQA